MSLIHVLCSDGSPIGVTCSTIYGQDGRIGCGGAELALLTMCEAWQKRGHTVVVYNDPNRKGSSPFEHRAISKFRAEDERDILVVFRSPTQNAVNARGLKIWWSCDQWTQPTHNYKAFGPLVDKIVCISPYHAKYFADNYGIQNAIVTDLPVRLDDYNGSEGQIPKRCIFTSVPDRGLAILRKLWPVILERHPDASLLITSDYRLWGALDPSNTSHRVSWLGASNVLFRGAMKRPELVKEQMRAQFHLYPSTYEELFCIAVAESMVAGAFPITNDKAALATTNLGDIIHGDMEKKEYWFEYTDKVDERMRNGCPDLRQAARERFDPQKIAAFWDKEIFNG